MLPGGRPEHEIPHGFPREGVHCHEVVSRVNPLWADARHEFHFLREHPWLFVQKVEIPFCRVMREKRHHSSSLDRLRGGVSAVQRRSDTLKGVTLGANSRKI